MEKLILFEFKKILKSKFNIIMILLVFGICFYMTIDHVKHYYDNSYTTVISFSNEKMSSYEVLQYLDEFWHSHVQDVDENYFEKMELLKNAMMEEYALNELDEEKMSAIYGENYQNFMQAGIDGTMSYEKIHEYSVQCEDRYYQYMKDYPHYTLVSLNGDVTFSLKPFYKNEQFMPLMNILFNKLDNLQYLYHEEKHELYMWEDLPQIYLDYISDRYESLPNHVDSSVGLDMLIYLFSGVNTNFIYMLLILLILILTSGLFSIEKEAKVEQVLMCTAKGYKEVTTAKLICAVLIAIAVMGGYLLFACCYIRSIVPFRDWNTPYISSFLSLPLIYTYKDIILIPIGMFIMAALAASMMSAFLSCLTKNRFICAVVLIILFMLPYFVTFQQGYYLWALIPTMMTEALNFLLWGFGRFGYQVPLVKIGTYLMPLYLWVRIIWGALIILMCIYCYFSQKKHLLHSKDM